MRNNDETRADEGITKLSQNLSISNNNTTNNNNKIFQILHERILEHAPNILKNNNIGTPNTYSYPSQDNNEEFTKAYIQTVAVSLKHMARYEGYYPDSRMSHIGAGQNVTVLTN